MIENIRALHAEIDRECMKIVTELQNKEKTNHRINNCLLGVQEKSSELLNYYRDSDRLVRNEIRSLTGRTLQETVKSFDDKLKDILNRHYTQDQLGAPPVIPEKLDQQKMKLPFFRQHLHQNEIPFSVEERYGRFLDLHVLYHQYMNLFLDPNTPLSEPKKRVDYLTYLKIISLFHRIDRRKKIAFRQQYHAYLQNLYNYLLGFHKRTQPLGNISHVMMSTEKYFQEKWDAGTLPGWTRDKTKTVPPPPMMPKSVPPPPLVIQPTMVSKDSNADNDTNKKKKKKKKKKKRRRKKGKVQQTIRNIALLEVKITRFLNLLDERLESTRSYVSKKQLRTYSEFQREIVREHEKEQELVEEEEKRYRDEKFRRGGGDEADDDPYAALGSNPLNLPLGWDGKPIPYWLYKIYQLGVEYKCEICGNYTYWGRRAFERHFNEWRHSHGMKCLGIPNTKHFHGISDIKEAVELWARMKQAHEKDEWKVEMEEFEDREGNVYSKKTFEELKRQGMFNMK